MNDERSERPTEQATPVDEAMKRLDYALDRLDETTQELAGKLYMALAPDADEEGEKSDAVAAVPREPSPLVRFMRAEAERAFMLDRRLRFLLDRIEL